MSGQLDCLLADADGSLRRSGDGCWAIVSRRLLVRVTSSCTPLNAVKLGVRRKSFQIFGGLDRP